MGYNNKKKVKMTSKEPSNSIGSSCQQCGLKFSNEDILALHECLQIKQEKSDLEHMPEKYLETVPEYLTDTIVKQENLKSEIKEEEHWSDYEEQNEQSFLQQEDLLTHYYQQNEMLQEIPVHIKGKRKSPTKNSHQHQSKRKTKSVKNTEVRPHQCNLCEFAFTRKVDLTVHMSKIHDIKEQFACTACGVIFTRKCNLTQHYSTVHEGKKPFKCKKCEDVSFTSKRGLDLHMSSFHEGKKPFKCHICDAEFTQNTHMRSHIATVHEGKRPFKCADCEASFAKRGDLNRHVSSIHEGKKRICLYIM